MEMSEVDTDESLLYSGAAVCLLITTSVISVYPV